MSKKIKKCKDCTFSKFSFLWGWDGAKCLHKSSIHGGEPEYHQGRSTDSATVYRLCSTMRYVRFDCGPEANLFSPRGS